MIQGGRSGVGRYVIELAPALMTCGVELHIVGMDSDRRHFPDLPDDCWVTIPGWARNGPLNLLWHQMFLPGIAKRGRFDLVHIPSYRRMLATCPVPRIATIHDCAPFILAEKYDALRGFFGRKVVPWLARRTDRVIAVSETAGKDIAHYLGVPSDRVRTVHNGIDHSVFRPTSEADRTAFRERMNLRKPYLVYISRLEHPAKNHCRLIRAFSAFRERSGCDWDFVLGGAPWHGHEIIEQTRLASPHADAIRMAGFVDDADLPLWYGAAEGLVFPSLMEGFGFPVIEAQACGTLVATSDATSLAEVAGPAALRFDPLDEAAIADALVALANMPAGERTRRIAEGIAWASAFTWETAAAKVVNVYREVTDG